MYQPKPWEQGEQHAGYGILMGGKKDKKYHHQDKYDSEKGPGSEYNSNKGSKEKDEKKESLFEEEEQKKNEEIKEEDIPFRAAKQVFAETMKEQQTKDHKKKNLSSIDEAIKKAIEDEKKIIMMD